MTKRIDLNIEDVKADLQHVFNEYNCCSCTTYKKYGKYNPQLFKKKLGLTFSQIKEELGLSVRKYNYSKQEITEDILRVFQEQGYMSKDIYLEFGKYSRKPIDRHFGSWNKMLLELQLPVNCLLNIPEDDLLNDLRRVYQSAGFICAEIVKSIGKYSLEVYQRRFGNFNNALTRAGLDPNVDRKPVLANYIFSIISEILDE